MRHLFIFFLLSLLFVASLAQNNLVTSLTPSVIGKGTTPSFTLNTSPSSSIKFAFSLNNCTTQLGVTSFTTNPVVLSAALSTVGSYSLCYSTASGVWNVQTTPGVSLTVIEASATDITYIEPSIIGVGSQPFMKLLTVVATPTSKIAFAANGQCSSARVAETSISTLQNLYQITSSITIARVYYLCYSTDSINWIQQTSAQSSLLVIAATPTIITSMSTTLIAAGALPTINITVSNPNIKTPTTIISFSLTADCNTIVAQTNISNGWPFKLVSTITILGTYKVCLSVDNGETWVAQTTAGVELKVAAASSFIASATSIAGISPLTIGINLNVSYTLTGAFATPTTYFAFAADQQCSVASARLAVTPYKVDGPVYISSLFTVGGLFKLCYTVDNVNWYQQTSVSSFVVLHNSATQITSLSPISLGLLSVGVTAQITGAGISAYAYIGFAPPGKCSDPKSLLSVKALIDATVFGQTLSVNLDVFIAVNTYKLCYTVNDKQTWIEQTPALSIFDSSSSSISAITPSVVPVNIVPSITFYGGLPLVTNFIGFAPSGQCSINLVAKTMYSSNTLTLSSAITKAGVYSVCYSVNLGLTWTAQTVQLTVVEATSTSITSISPSEIGAGTKPIMTFTGAAATATTQIAFALTSCSSNRVGLTAYTTAGSVTLGNAIPTVGLYMVCYTVDGTNWVKQTPTLNVIQSTTMSITAINPSPIEAGTQPAIQCVGIKTGAQVFVSYVLTAGTCNTATRYGETNYPTSDTATLGVPITTPNTYRVCLSYDGKLTWTEQLSITLIVYDSLTAISPSVIGVKTGPGETLTGITPGSTIKVAYALDGQCLTARNGLTSYTAANVSMGSTIDTVNVYRICLSKDNGNTWLQMTKNGVTLNVVEATVGMITAISPTSVGKDATVTVGVTFSSSAVVLSTSLMSFSLNCATGPYYLSKAPVSSSSYTFSIPASNSYLVCYSLNNGQTWVKQSPTLKVIEALPTSISAISPSVVGISATPTMTFTGATVLSTAQIAFALSGQCGSTRVGVILYTTSSPKLTAITVANVYDVCYTVNGITWVEQTAPNLNLTVTSGSTSTITDINPDSIEKGVSGTVMTMTGLLPTLTTQVAFAITCTGTKYAVTQYKTSTTATLSAAINTAGTYKVCYSLNAGSSYDEQTLVALTVVESITSINPSTISNGSDTTFTFGNIVTGSLAWVGFVAYTDDCNNATLRWGSTLYLNGTTVVKTSGMKIGSYRICYSGDGGKSWVKMLKYSLSLNIVMTSGGNITLIEPKRIGCGSNPAITYTGLILSPTTTVAYQAPNCNATCANNIPTFCPTCACSQCNSTHFIVGAAGLTPLTSSITGAFDLAHRIFTAGTYNLWYTLNNVTWVQQTNTNTQLNVICATSSSITAITPSTIQSNNIVSILYSSNIATKTTWVGYSLTASCNGTLLGQTYVVTDVATNLGSVIPTVGVYYVCLSVDNKATWVLQTQPRLNVIATVTSVSPSLIANNTLTPLTIGGGTVAADSQIAFALTGKCLSATDRYGTTPFKTQTITLASPIRFSGKFVICVQQGNSDWVESSTPSLTVVTPAANNITSVSPSIFGKETTPLMTFSSPAATPTTVIAFALNGQCGTTRVGVTYYPTASSVTLGAAIPTAGTYVVCYSLDSGSTWVQQAPQITVLDQLASSITDINPDLIGVGATPLMTFTGAVGSSTTQISFALPGQCSTTRVGLTPYPNTVDTALKVPITVSGVYKVCYSVNGGKSWVEQVPTLTVKKPADDLITAIVPSAIEVQKTPSIKILGITPLSTTWVAYVLSSSTCASTSRYGYTNYPNTDTATLGSAINPTGIYKVCVSYDNQASFTDTGLTLSVYEAITAIVPQIIGVNTNPQITLQGAVPSATTVFAFAPSGQCLSASARVGLTQLTANTVQLGKAISTVASWNLCYSRDNGVNWIQVSASATVLSTVSASGSTITAVTPNTILVGQQASLTFTGATPTPTTYIWFASSGQCNAQKLSPIIYTTTGAVTMSAGIPTIGSYVVCYSVDAGVTVNQQQITLTVNPVGSISAISPNTWGVNAKPTVTITGDLKINTMFAFALNGKCSILNYGKTTITTTATTFSVQIASAITLGGTYYVCYLADGSNYWIQQNVTVSVIDSGPSAIQSITPNIISVNTQPSISLQGALMVSTSQVAFVQTGQLCSTAANRLAVTVYNKDPVQISASIPNVGLYQVCYSVDSGSTWTTQTAVSLTVISANASSITAVSPTTIGANDQEYVRFVGIFASQWTYLQFSKSTCGQSSDVFGKFPVSQTFSLIDAANNVLYTDWVLIPATTFPNPGVYSICYSTDGTNYSQQTPTLTVNIANPDSIQSVNPSLFGNNSVIGTITVSGGTLSPNSRIGFARSGECGKNIVLEFVYATETSVVSKKIYNFPGETTSVLSVCYSINGGDTYTEQTNFRVGITVIAATNTSIKSVEPKYIPKGEIPSVTINGATPMVSTRIAFAEDGECGTSNILDVPYTTIQTINFDAEVPVVNQIYWACYSVNYGENWTQQVLPTSLIYVYMATPTAIKSITPNYIQPGDQPTFTFTGAAPSACSKLFFAPVGQCDSIPDASKIISYTTEGPTKYPVPIMNEGVYSLCYSTNCNDFVEQVNPTTKLTVTSNQVNLLNLLDINLCDLLNLQVRISWALPVPLVKLNVDLTLQRKGTNGQFVDAGVIATKLKVEQLSFTWKVDTSLADGTYRIKLYIDNSLSILSLLSITTYTLPFEINGCITTKPIYDTTSYICNAYQPVVSWTSLGIQNFAKSLVKIDLVSAIDNSTVKADITSGISSGDLTLGAQSTFKWTSFPGLNLDGNFSLRISMSSNADQVYNFVTQTPVFIAKTCNFLVSEFPSNDYCLDSVVGVKFQAIGMDDGFATVNIINAQKQVVKVIAANIALNLLVGNVYEFYFQMNASVMLGAPQDSYAIQVVKSALSDLTKVDVISDTLTQPFTVASCDLAVTSPATGSSLCNGDQITVEWTYAGSLDNQKATISLVDATNNQATVILSNVLVSDKKASWTVSATPELFNAESAGRYKILIETNVANQDGTSQKFTASSPGTFHVYSCSLTSDQLPPSNNIFCDGERTVISWNSNGLLNNVSISLKEVGKEQAVDLGSVNVQTGSLILPMFLNYSTENSDSQYTLVIKYSHFNVNPALEQTLEIVSSTFYIKNCSLSLSTPFPTDTNPPSDDQTDLDTTVTRCIYDSYTIVWSSTGLPSGSAELHLVDDNVLSINVSTLSQIVDVVAQTQFKWTLPETVMSGVYRLLLIRYGDSLRPDVFTYSEVFQIQRCSVNITQSPLTTSQTFNTETGLASICSGDKQVIEWTNVGLNGTVDINLLDSTGTSVVATLAEGYNVTTGSYRWETDLTVSSASLSLPGQYKIQVIQKDEDSNILVKEDVTAVFMMLQCTLDIVQPTVIADESDLCYGDKYLVQWNMKGLENQKVKLELLSDVNVAIDPSISKLPSSLDSNAFPYTWELPAIGALSDGLYKFKLTRLGTELSQSVVAISKPFAISSCLLNLVKTPQENEKVCTGVNDSITWTSTGLYGDVDVYLVTPDFKTLADESSIVSKLGNTAISNNNYTFTNPMDVPDGDYKVALVKKVDNDLITPKISISPVYTLEKCTLSVTYPTDESTICTKNQMPITWTYTGVPTGTILIIDLVDVNGETVANIYDGKGEVDVTDTTNGWIVPESIAAGDYSVRISEIYSPAQPPRENFVVNSSYFEISQCSFSYTNQPGEQEGVCADDQKLIEWTYEGTVDRTLSIDFYEAATDKLVSTIATNVPIKAESFLWTVSSLSNELSKNKSYYLQLNEEGKVPSLRFDTSNMFSLSDCSISFNETSAASYCSSDVQPITWQVTGFDGTILINLVDSASKTLVTKISNGPVPATLGLFLWSIPSPVSLSSQGPYMIEMIRQPSTSNQYTKPVTQYSEEFKLYDCSVTITHGPIEGDKYCANDSNIIRWDNVGLAGQNISIELYSGANPEPVALIANISIDKHEYSLPIDLMALNATSGEKYFIKVTSIPPEAKPNQVIASYQSLGNVFTLYNCQVNISLPQDSDSSEASGILCYKDTFNINWNFTGPDSSIVLNLVKDTDEGTEVVIPNLANSALTISDKTYTWDTSLMAELLNGLYRIEIVQTRTSLDTDVAYTTVISRSALFSFYNCEISLGEAPTDSEYLCANNQEMLRWSAVGLPGSNVTVELISSDSTQAIITLAEAIPIEQAGVIWTIPSALPEDDTYTLRITTFSAGSVKQSHTTVTSSFRIIQCGLSFFTPVVNYTYCYEDFMTIEWSTTESVNGRAQIDLIAYGDDASLPTATSTLVTLPAGSEKIYRFNLDASELSITEGRYKISIKYLMSETSNLLKDVIGVSSTFMIYNCSLEYAYPDIELTLCLDDEIDLEWIPVHLTGNNLSLFLIQDNYKDDYVMEFGPFSTDTTFTNWTISQVLPNGYSIVPGLSYKFKIEQNNYNETDKVTRTSFSSYFKINNCSLKLNTTSFWSNQLCSGDQYHLNWSSSGLDGWTSIYIIESVTNGTTSNVSSNTNFTVVYEIGKGLPVETQEIDFVLPANISGDARYQVLITVDTQIEGVFRSMRLDLTDVFMVNNCSVNVTSPNPESTPESSYVCSLDTMPIQWISSGSSGDFVLNLIDAETGSFVSNILTGDEISVGAYSWVVNTSTIVNLNPSAAYQVELVSHPNDVTKAEVSSISGKFAIKDCSLTVKLPAVTDAQVCSQNTKDIVWQSTGLSGLTNITLQSQTSLDNYVIAENVDISLGVFSWDSMSVPEGRYILFITHITASEVNATYTGSSHVGSTQEFIVTNCSMNVTLPVREGLLCKSDAHMFHWNFTGLPANAIIELVGQDDTVVPSYESGLPDTPLTNSSYLWTVPYSVPDGQYRLKTSYSPVTSNSDSSPNNNLKVEAFSDVFNVRLCQIFLVDEPTNICQKDVNVLNWDSFGLSGDFLVNVHVVEIPSLKIITTLASMIPITQHSLTWTPRSLPLGLTTKSSILIDVVPPVNYYNKPCLNRTALKVSQPVLSSPSASYEQTSQYTQASQYSPSPSPSDVTGDAVLGSGVSLNSILSSLGLGSFIPSGSSEDLSSGKVSPSAGPSKVQEDSSADQTTGLKVIESPLAAKDAEGSSSALQEDVKETSSAQEDVKESSSAANDVKESSSALQEDVKETSSAQEDVKESTTLQEDVKEPRLVARNVEDVKESSIVQEDVKETSSALQEEVKESSLAAKNAEESSIVQEDVKETSSALQEEVKESSSALNEDVKESSSALKEDVKASPSPKASPSDNTVQPTPSEQGLNRQDAFKVSPSAQGSPSYYGTYSVAGSPSASPSELFTAQGSPSALATEHTVFTYNGITYVIPTSTGQPLAEALSAECKDVMTSLVTFTSKQIYSSPFEINQCSLNVITDTPANQKDICLKQGVRLQITWESFGFTDSITLNVVNQNTNEKYMISSSVPVADQSYTWFVPMDLPESLITSRSAPAPLLIQIVRGDSLTTAEVNGTQNTPFYLHRCDIYLYDPVNQKPVEGPLTTQPGENVTLKWDLGIEPKTPIKIVLVNDDTFEEYVLAPEFPADPSGEYTYPVDDKIPPGNYHFEVPLPTESNPDQKFESPSFTVNPKPSPSYIPPSPSSNTATDTGVVLPGEGEQTTGVAQPQTGAGQSPTGVAPQTGNGQTQTGGLPQTGAGNVVPSTGVAPQTGAGQSQNGVVSQTGNGQSPTGVAPQTGKGQDGASETEYVLPGEGSEGTISSTGAAQPQTGGISQTGVAPQSGNGQNGASQSGNGQPSAPQTGGAPQSGSETEFVLPGEGSEDTISSTGAAQPQTGGISQTGNALPSAGVSPTGNGQPQNTVSSGPNAGQSETAVVLPSGVAPQTGTGQPQVTATTRPNSGASETEFQLPGEDSQVSQSGVQTALPTNALPQTGTFFPAPPGGASQSGVQTALPTDANPQSGNVPPGAQTGAPQTGNVPPPPPGAQTGAPQTGDFPPPPPPGAQTGAPQSGPQTALGTNVFPTQTGQPQNTVVAPTTPTTPRWVPTDDDVGKEPHTPIKPLTGNLVPPVRFADDGEPVFCSNLDIDTFKWYPLSGSGDITPGTTYVYLSLVKASDHSIVVLNFGDAGIMPYEQFSKDLILPKVPEDVLYQVRVVYMQQAGNSIGYSTPFYISACIMKVTIQVNQPYIKPNSTVTGDIEVPPGVKVVKVIVVNSDEPTNPRTVIENLPVTPHTNNSVRITFPPDTPTGYYRVNVTEQRVPHSVGNNTITPITTISNGVIVFNDTTCVNPPSSAGGSSTGKRSTTGKSTTGKSQSTTGRKSDSTTGSKSDSTTGRRSSHSDSTTGRRSGDSGIRIVIENNNHQSQEQHQDQHQDQDQDNDNDNDNEDHHSSGSSSSSSSGSRSGTTTTTERSSSSGSRSSSESSHSSSGSRSSNSDSRGSSSGSRHSDSDSHGSRGSSGSRHSDSDSKGSSSGSRHSDSDSHGSRGSSGSRHSDSGSRGSSGSRDSSGSRGSSGSRSSGSSGRRSSGSRSSSGRGCNCPAGCKCVCPESFSSDSSVVKPSLIVVFILGLLFALI